MVSNSSSSFDKHKLEKLINDGVAKQASQLRSGLQSSLDRLLRECQGQPVESIKPRVSSAFRRAGITPDANQVQRAAEALAAGTRYVIEMKVEKLRL